MDRKRYIELEKDANSHLTPEELQQGWHFCPDWDYMLIQKGSDAEECYCKISVDKHTKV